MDLRYFSRETPMNDHQAKAAWKRLTPDAKADLRARARDQHPILKPRRDDSWILTQVCIDLLRQETQHEKDTPLFAEPGPPVQSAA